MAFNPFASFRKYQKFWIAALILLCMLSFIVCSGMGFEQIFTQLINQWRGGRTPVVTINGTGVTSQELREVERQRKIANAFMRAAAETAIESLNGEIKTAQEKLTKAQAQNKDQKLIAQYSQMIFTAKLLREQLWKKLRQDYFFGTGTKLNDLVTFMLWRKQADRLGIQFVADDLEREIKRQVLGHMTGFFARQSWIAEAKVRAAEGSDVSADDIRRAVEQELRVQTAKLALAGVRPTGLLVTAEQVRMANQDPTVFFYRVSAEAPEWRLAMTPYEMWNTYKQKRTLFDVALLPVPVENFAKDIKTKPSDSDLKVLFNKHKTKTNDPESDEPGFIKPEKAKFTYITTDPDSEYYQLAARAATTLQRTPPVWPSIGMPGFGTALAIASAPSQHDTVLQRNYKNLLRLSLQRDHERFKTFFDKIVMINMPKQKADDEKDKKNDKKTEPVENEGLLGWWLTSEARDYDNMVTFLGNNYEFLQAPWTNPNFALRIYASSGEPTPKAAAGVVGDATLMALSGSSMTNFQAFVNYQRAAIEDQKTKMAPIVKKEIGVRTRVGASLVLSALSPTPFSALGQWDLAYRKITYMPAEVFAERFRKIREVEMAHNRIPDVMEDVRDTLQTENAQGNPTELVGLLAQVKSKYPGLRRTDTNELVPQLQISTTDDWVNKYTVDDNLRMKTFKNIFDMQATVQPGQQMAMMPGQKKPQPLLFYFNMFEGRTRTPRQLTQDDFWKLFFDASEDFSPASKESYTVMQWPPQIEPPQQQRLMDDPDQMQVITQAALQGQKQKIDSWVLKGHLPLHNRFAVFWRGTADAAPNDQVYQGKQRPTTVDEAKEEVEKAWKFLQARKPALEKAKAIADLLIKERTSGNRYNQVLQDQADKLGVKVIRLDSVSQWYRDKINNAYRYYPWKLPKDTIAYPRDDMAKSILALKNLQQPLKTALPATAKDIEGDGEDKDLDAVNKTLHIDPKTLGTEQRQVQILTNKPRTKYYVAVVLDVQVPETFEFADRYAASVSAPQDLFVTEARQKAAERHLEELSQQLWREAKVEIHTRENFDN